MTLIDTHAHLDQIEDIDQVLKNAQLAGVSKIVAVSVDLASSQKILEIKKKTLSPQIYAGFGMHPGDIKMEDFNGCLAFIKDHIQDSVAIGEIGLDFWYKGVKKDLALKEQQKKVFVEQLKLTKAFDRVAIIHSRGAWKECLEAAQEFDIKRAVFHWYSGPVNVLENILAAGFYISATPSLSYSLQAKEAVAATPMERILIETDSPVRYKMPDEEFNAQPKDVFRTLKLCCALKNRQEDEAAQIFNDNAAKLFGF